ncbi:maleylpyruvate isomerase family mycothiol-dependent enzyme [Nocardioides lentus]|uniref:Maleylpyruvate isomerase family mycothiol-dependent enzyme n=1 Tax=Nocardioides lentus TaxID=338077 RepID=A0ABP5ALM7_9ACTN
MTDIDVMAEAEAERRDLAALLADLDDGEWAAPSLCAGWTVRDVVAHLLSFEGLGPRVVAATLLRGRTVAGTNAVALARWADAGPAELRARLDAFPRPTGLTAALGGSVGLVDGVIHAQDVRRPLARPRAIPAPRLRHCLGFAVTAPPLRGFWAVRGVRVVATDVDFAHGRGPEARGTGEAVLMTLAGRRGVAAELTGPGADRLRARLG